MNELALFAGAGGGILGGHLLGWRTICAVEWDAYAASVLVHRQNDGCLPPFPIWSDVQTFDGRPWRGRVDVISGGFPCQDISSAGKGAGIDGERSGMWGHMARIIGQVRPEFCMVENSPLLVGRGLARVLGDLASLGYDAKWGVLGARNAGAPHKRDRIWIVANSDCGRQPRSVRPGEENGGGATGASQRPGKVPHADLCRFVEPIDGEKRREGVDSRESPGNRCGTSEDVADSHGRQSQVGWENGRMGRILVPSVNSPSSEGRKMWEVEPKLGRVANGVAHRLDRLKCIGNGQVPHCAALAWRILASDE